MHRPRRATLEDFNPKNNAGRPLYLCFAFAVVYSHAFVLGGYDQAPRFKWSNYSVSFGTMGVTGFFILGGFLTTASLHHSGARGGRFLFNRCMRLLPAIWVSLSVTGLVLAPLSLWLRFRSLDGYAVFGEGGAASYLLKNGFFVQAQWTIGSTLRDAPFPISWNGSLWTMASLFVAFILTATLVAVGLVRGRRWLALVVGAAIWMLMSIVDTSIFAVDLRRMGWVTEPWQAILVGPDSLQLICLFLAGSAAYLYRQYLPIGPLATVTALGFLVLSFAYREWHLYGGLAWAYFSLILLVRLPLRMSSRLGWLPFGIYLWAFPVEQFAALIKLNSFGYALYATTCAGVASIAALLTYCTVDRPLARMRAWSATRQSAGAALAPIERPEP